MALQGEAAKGFRVATVSTERERRVEGPHKVIVVGDPHVGELENGFNGGDEK